MTDTLEDRIKKAREEYRVAIKCYADVGHRDLRYHDDALDASAREEAASLRLARLLEERDGIGSNVRYPTGAEYQEEIASLKLQLEEERESARQHVNSMRRVHDEIRAETIEECAKVCESRAQRWPTMWDCGAWQRSPLYSEDIACSLAIRALKGGDSK